MQGRISRSNYFVTDYFASLMESIGCVSMGYIPFHLLNDASSSAAECNPVRKGRY